MPSLEPALIPACILLLNSHPGVGKYTLALNLRALLSPTQPARVISHHAFENLAETLEPGHSSAHYELCISIQHLSFVHLSSTPSSHPNLVIVFTDCLAHTSSHMAKFAEYVSIARRREVPFISINLTCGLEENKRRLRERVMDPKGRVVDPDMLEMMKRNFTLLDPKGLVMADFEEGMRFHLELDTTGMDVRKTAKIVREFLRNPMAGQMEGLRL